VSSALLSVSDLHKSYAVPVLRGVNFEVDAGQVHALVGANGAGKTTLCRIICGLTARDGGSMRVEGNPYQPASVVDAEEHGIRARRWMQSGSSAWTRVGKSERLASVSVS